MGDLRDSKEYTMSYGLYQTGFKDSHYVNLHVSHCVFEFYPQYPINKST